MQSRLVRAAQSEEGHALPALGALIGGAGVVLLGIGAAGGTDWLTIVGGIAGGVGLLASQVLNHVTVDYDMYGRLENLEKK
jgi:hypothetical protein